MKIRYLGVTGIIMVTACVLASAAIRDSGAKEVGTSKPTAAASTAKARKAPARPRFTEYQVAAGSAVSIELRTRLSSNGSRRADAIEGRLLRPLISTTGVELVPAGATVMGTVSEVEAAGINRPGRLEFGFQIVEHPGTGSRATIRTEVLRFASPVPAKGKLFADVRLEKGADASVVLLAPLVVRIPAAD